MEETAHKDAGLLTRKPFRLEDDFEETMLQYSGLLDADDTSQANSDVEPLLDSSPPRSGAHRSRPRQDGPRGAAMQVSQIDHFTELRIIGFALAKSTGMLPEFNTRVGPKCCFDVIWMKSMYGVCTESDTRALAQCMHSFFTKRPMLQNTNETTPRQDPTAAPVLKSEADINEAWRLIMEKRRLVLPDDALPINDTNKLAAMFNEWEDQWMDEYLTREQLKQSRPMRRLWRTRFRAT